MTSAGRSEGNPTRPDAVRRFTSDERAQFIGVPEDESQDVSDVLSTPTDRRLRRLVALLIAGAGIITAAIAGSVLAGLAYLLSVAIGVMLHWLWVRA